MNAWPSTFPSFADPSLRLSTVSSLARLSWTVPAAGAATATHCLPGSPPCASLPLIATRALWLLELNVLRDTATVPLSRTDALATGPVCCTAWVWSARPGCC